MSNTQTTEPLLDPRKALETLMAQAREGQRFYARMATLALEETDKQVAENLKWAHAAQEQVVAGRTQALKMMNDWTERGMSVAAEMAGTMVNMAGAWRKA